MMDQTFVYVVHNIKHRWVIMWELSVGLCPYLLLLDQTILLHFRSSIDRPLNGYLRIPVVITISVSRKKIYNQSLGAYEKKLFWMKWSLFYFYLTFVYDCYVPTYHRFLRKRLLLKYQNVVCKRLEYLNIFPSFFKKFNTSWNQKKYFNSICVLFILIIW